MSDINTAFTREVLKQTMVDVRKHTTKEERDGAWVYCTLSGRRVSNRHYEFHGPNEFYWHGRADNAYDARSHGWCAYLRKIGVKEYQL